MRIVPGCGRADLTSRSYVDQFRSLREQGRSRGSAIGCTSTVVSSALLDCSPVHTQSVAVQEQCSALSVVLLKPKDAAVHGQHVDAP